MLHLCHRMLGKGQECELPDPELLRRFRAERDQAAFLALLRRHGPMVLAVCRGVLGHEADAEDAFQATFLLLARKAGTIRQTESLGSWLHGVAYRTALKAQAQRRSRQEHEACVPPRQEVAPEDVTWREVQQVLHEEICCLPERYRAPLVLCYLEGCTQEAAAAHLHLAKSTLRERLERGRNMLRTRLVRRGVEPAALLAVVVWPAATTAGIRTTLEAATLRAACWFVSGEPVATGIIPTKIATLTEGGLRMTLLQPLSISALLVLLVLGAWGGLALGERPLAAVDLAPPSQQSAPVQNTPLPAQVVAVENWHKTFVWGNTVAGVQVGLALEPGARPVVAPGQTLSLYVKVRNVTSKQIKLRTLTSYFRQFAPTVADASGKRYSVTMPPPAGGWFSHHTLEPGEEYLLHRDRGFADTDTQLAIASPGTVGEVFVPTVQLPPGKYRIKYENMLAAPIPSYGTEGLATGELQIEVTSRPAPAAEPEMAWGKPHGSFQVGVGLAPGQSRTLRLGETLSLVVKVRNVGATPDNIDILTGPFDSWRPYFVVRDANGQRQTVLKPPPLRYKRVVREQWLKPGEMIEVGTAQVDGQELALRGPRLRFAPQGDADLISVPTVRVAPGKYRLRFEQCFENGSDLHTGDLEVEVRPPTP
jgi:RNA polymerase sigma factor (sigma-70 family)